MLAQLALTGPIAQTSVPMAAKWEPWWEAHREDERAKDRTE